MIHQLEDKIIEIMIALEDAGYIVHSTTPVRDLGIDDLRSTCMYEVLFDCLNEPLSDTDYIKMLRSKDDSKIREAVIDLVAQLNHQSINKSEFTNIITQSLNHEN